MKNLRLNLAFLFILFTLGIWSFISSATVAKSTYQTNDPFIDCSYQDAYLPTLSNNVFTLNEEVEDNYSSENPTGPIYNNVIYHGDISNQYAQGGLDIDYFFFQIEELGTIAFEFIALDEPTFIEQDIQVQLKFSGSEPREVTAQDRLEFESEPDYSFEHEATNLGWYYLMIAGVAKSDELPYQFTVKYPQPEPAGVPVSIPPCPTETSIPLPDAYCDLPPRYERHSYVINFDLDDDGYLVSNGSQADAETDPYQIFIPQGIYRVTLSSYDNHSTKDTDLPQEDERWHLIFKNSINDEIALSNPAQDLDEEEDCTIQVVEESLTINEDITTVIARHTVFPDPENEANSIIPDYAILTPVE